VAFRQPWLDHLTRYGTILGSTEVVILLTVLGCLVLAWRGHGPRLPVFLLTAVLGETLLFLLAQLLLHRTRPPVLRLDPAAATSSFPSGHTAASVALWVGLAVGLAGTRPAHRLLTPVRVLAVVLPGFVLFARLYRGMHWPSDVLGSVLFVALWLLLLRRILLPPTDQVMPAQRP
jgi:undecaprenyl-diphosphatase